MSDVTIQSKLVESLITPNAWYTDLRIEFGGKIYGSRFPYRMSAGDIQIEQQAFLRRRAKAAGIPVREG